MRRELNVEKAKSNSVITTQVDGEHIVFKVKDAGELKFNTGLVSDAVRQRAMIHGLIQRISDRAALSRDTKTGKSASPEDKLAAMRGLVEHYESGSEMWAMERSGGGGTSIEVMLLVKALSELYKGKSEDELRAWVMKRTKNERLALSEGEKLKPIIERLKAEQSAGVDAEELLGELEGPEGPEGPEDLKADET